MRYILAKRIGYPLKDLYSKVPILETKHFLDASQYWDEARMQEYRLKKLKSLVAHAYNNVPYYTEIFNNIGLKPEYIETLDDITRIPVLTKDVLREYNTRLLDSNWGKKMLIKAKTGGTTGPPVPVYKDKNAYAFEWGSYYRWFNWIGIKIGDPIVTFWGSPTVLTSSLKQKAVKKINNFLTNQIQFNSFELSDNSIPGIIGRLDIFKPKLIKGYLSAILQIANFLNKKNIRLSYYPTALSTTSETLLYNQREFLKNIFGCPVFDQYGCTEITAVAYECAMHNGMHITQEHVIAEVLSDNYKDSVTRGKLILTDLDCYVMPLIRYENGDLISLSDTNCSCGINQPLIESVVGREAQTITLKNGNEVHGVFFTDLLYELPGEGAEIIKFQVYQSNPGDIEFRYEAASSLPESQLFRLEKALLAFFNHVKIIRFDKIPFGPSGKHSYLLKDFVS